jgi:asparagine synthase (glutamine-hydrolysing)
MCGIVGMIARNASVPVELLERATQSLAHRGPDDHGTVIFSDRANEPIEIGLGTRRLAILDLSPAGHQPMTDPCTGNWIVYNGELYNFRELRARLERFGLSFTSHSDTEVILKAYGYWGEECLAEFRGMFAFAIWDAKQHRLFLARDPMGIKPLYYYKSDSHFLFSSEVRTLLGTGLVPRAIDYAGLVNYLTFGSLYDPVALLDGIRSLPPACSLTWNGGQLKQRHYWDLLDAADPTNGGRAVDRSETETRIGEMLSESVQMQLVSDVPVGVFLSGGIDSSALVAILSRNGVRPSTFSIVFRERDYSEAEYSRTVAQQFRSDHHEITVSQSDFLDTIQPAIDAMDLPTIDGLNTYFVSQQAMAASVKVVLSGLGGDEAFAGYSNFRSVPRAEKLLNLWRRTPKLLRSPLAATFAALAPASDQNRKLACLAHDPEGSVHPYFLSRMLFTPHQRQRLLPDQQRYSSGVRRLENALVDCLDRTRTLDPVNRISYLEMRCYMLNTLLRDVDCMSMAHGIEVRVPLIDHQLARWVLALPEAMKLDRSIPKPLLVRAVSGQLPDKVVRRRKRGFTLPFEHWMRDELRPRVEQRLQRIGDGVLGDMISAQGVRSVWNDFLAGRTSWSRPWALYVLQCWCERHLCG